MVQGSPIARLTANAIAGVALRVPLIERLLVVGTRQPLLRRHLRLGAIALGYPRILRRREIRLAEMDGYRFFVNIGESLGVGPYFFRESGAVWLVRDLVRHGDVCVDAGANAGHYTFLCASLVGDSGRVYAFEPNPEFAALLRRSAALNPFGPIVHVEPRALFSSSGNVHRFLVSEDSSNTGTSSLVDHGWFQGDVRAIEVDTIAFDDFVRDAGVNRFRLVKIDVERAEEFVVAGAQRALAEGRIDYLIVEMHSGSAAHSLLEQAGYGGYLIFPDDRTLQDVREVATGRFGDFLFVRPGLTPPSGAAMRSR